MFVAGARHLDAPDGSVTGVVRPLRLGLSIGHPCGSVGTLGGFVTPRGQSEAGILSSATVLWPPDARIGDYIHQPGPIDNPLFTGETRIAQITSSVPLSRSRRTSVDAAYARLLPDMPCEGNVIPAGLPDAGTCLRPLPEPAPRVGDHVAKFGRGTGYTTGQVTAVAMTFTVHGTERARTWKGDSAEVTDAIEIEGEAGAFSGPGDTGAVVWRIEDGAAVGLLFASSRPAAGPARSFAHPLALVLDALHVTWL